MEIAALARRITEAIDDADYAEITDEIRANPAAPGILAELARVRDPEVRGFVPRAARLVLGREGVPLLKKLLDDRDPDIRGMALDELEQLDLRILVPYMARLRRRLASTTDDDEVLSTGWTLVRLGDVEAIPVLEAYRSRHEAWTGNAKTAEVQLLALRDPAAVVERIRAHDHERMGWLAYAATIIATPAALDAVRWCADQGPDEGCRESCRHILAVVGRRARRG